jgi:hypothetical protein
MISNQKFTCILSRLATLLANLPINLPKKPATESIYASFLSFSLDPELLEHTGCEVTTLGEQLERVFGWKAHTTGDGILPIKEHGKLICVLHPLLKSFCHHHHNNNVLKKWVIDIVVGVEKIYAHFSTLVSGTKQKRAVLTRSLTWGNIFSASIGLRDSDY